MPAAGPLRHLHFDQLPSLLRRGDLLVLNDTRVIPARIRVDFAGSSGEILLLEPNQKAEVWECLVRPGRRFPKGALITLGRGVAAAVVQELPGGRRLLEFQPAGRLAAVLPTLGATPLPPYIHEHLDDPERYQTVYARVPGSAAAPTAGLHFTPEMFDRLTDEGVVITHLTLRIGLDTFQPLREEKLDEHRMHSEWYSVPAATMAHIDRCRARGGRVVAVGTTTARALETAALPQASLEGRTDLFIRPGHQFRVVDMLLTNFHLPKSSLLVMVSAFAGRERVLTAYQEAIKQRYRFYSFGDAMLLERFAL